MRILPVVAAALLVAGTAACSSDDDPKDTTAPTPTTAVTTPAGAPTGSDQEIRALSGNRWSVTQLSIKVGDTVKVIDADSDVPHNFVVEGVGQSKTMNDGDTFSLTFPKAGRFEFVCTFHESQGMTGTITVA